MTHRPGGRDRSPWRPLPGRRPLASPHRERRTARAGSPARGRAAAATTGRTRPSCCGGAAAHRAAAFRAAAAHWPLPPPGHAATGCGSTMPPVRSPAACLPGGGRSARPAASLLRPEQSRAAAGARTGERAAWRRTRRDRGSAPHLGAARWARPPHRPADRRAPRRRPAAVPCRPAGSATPRAD